MGSKFVIANPHKCIACKACMAACLVKHFVPGDVPVARLDVVRMNEGFTAPILCHHCEDAPCAAACPVGALYRDGDRVAVNLQACIGCRSCVMACPFGAVDVVERYDGSRLGGLVMGSVRNAVVVKCDRCVDREGGPACVEACAPQALRLMDDVQFDAIVREKRASHIDAVGQVAAAAAGEVVAAGA